MALDLPGNPLAPALRLLEEGRDQEALVLLLLPQEGPWEAERLALLGFVEARRGNLEAYRALALQAAQRAQTPLTLEALRLELEEALRRAALARTPSSSWSSAWGRTSRPGKPSWSSFPRKTPAFPSPGPGGKAQEGMGLLEPRSWGRV